MKVERDEKNGRGSFYVEEAGHRVAEMIYGTGNDQLIIYHTEVAHELQGKNVGMQLVHAAVDYARDGHLKIVPLCPFAKSVIDKVAAFQDVLAT